MRLAKGLRGEVLTSLRRTLTHPGSSSQRNKGKPEEMGCGRVCVCGGGKRPGLKPAMSNVVARGGPEM